MYNCSQNNKIVPESVQGLDDYLQDWAAPFNKFFRENNIARNMMLITGSGMIDIIVMT